MPSCSLTSRNYTSVDFTVSNTTYGCYYNVFVTIGGETTNTGQRSSETGSTLSLNVGTGSPGAGTWIAYENYDDPDENVIGSGTVPAYEDPTYYWNYLDLYRNYTSTDTTSIRYYSYYGTAGGSATANLNSDTSKSVLTRSGYIFKGYATTRGGTVYYVYDSDAGTFSPSSVTIPEDTTISLYAVWETEDQKFTYTITHGESSYTCTTPVTSVTLTNGDVTDTITAGGISRDLNCNACYMPNNLVIGEKTLNCANTYMVGNINITTEFYYPYLCFTALEAGSTITTTYSVSYSSAILYYSQDNGATWNVFYDGSGSTIVANTITLSNIGDTVLLRGDNSGGINDTSDIKTATDTSFVMTGSIAASGSIMSLLDNGMGTMTAIPNSGCFSCLFYGCTALTTPPELPATTLTSDCYISMFSGCTSLTTLPKLPAASILSESYYAMFYGCSNIKLSETQTGEYQYEYRIPTSATGTSASDGMTDMFTNTGGTFTGTPTVNTTYYTTNEPV